MIYVFYNPHYSGGKYRDFVAVEANSYDQAWKIADLPINGYRLWTITKGVSTDQWIRWWSRIIAKA